MIAERRIEASYGPSEGRASARAVRRALTLAGAQPAPASAPLEVQRTAETPPRVETATPLEGDRVSVRRVVGAPAVGIAAFLDGVQRSEIVAHHGLVPLVLGSVAAVVRERVERRMRTWGAPERQHAVYAPRAAMAPELLRAIESTGVFVDTSDEDGSTDSLRHPGDLAARALTAVQRDRERCEQLLAVRYLETSGKGPLLVDGGIAADARVAKHAGAIGVVKSHRTLYATEDSLAATLAMREGERTTAVAVRSPRRTTVASWYLRLRDAGARGPFFGLVRVEMAAEGHADLTARADLVSRWLLAERTPVSLPDARWDVMVYGVRDCEQYLSSILR